MRIYLSGYPLPEFGGINNLILLNQDWVVNVRLDEIFPV